MLCILACRDPTRLGFILELVSCSICPRVFLSSSMQIWKNDPSFFFIYYYSSYFGLFSSFADVEELSLYSGFIFVLFIFLLIRIPAHTSSLFWIDLLWSEHSILSSASSNSKSIFKKTNKQKEIGLIYCLQIPPPLPLLPPLICMEYNMALILFFLVAMIMQKWIE